MHAPQRIARIGVALQSVWCANPHLSFGQLNEKVEDVAWPQLEAATMRSYSARWMNLPDAYLESALAECARKGAL